MAKSNGWVEEMKMPGSSVPDRGGPTDLAGTRLDRLIGVWSARVIFAIGIGYLVTLTLGFLSLGKPPRSAGGPVSRDR